MSLLVNEYVDSVIHEELRTVAARRLDENRTEANFEAHVEANANQLTALALIVLNVLLVAAIGVNVSTTPIFSGVLVVGLALASVYTATKLKEMFGTSTQE